MMICSLTVELNDQLKISNDDRATEVAFSLINLTLPQVINVIKFTFDELLPQEEVEFMSFQRSCLRATINGIFFSLAHIREEQIAIFRCVHPVMALLLTLLQRLDLLELKMQERLQ